jgi:hypothetical protein
MNKADPTLVAELVEAMRAACAEDSLRAELVAENVDDVDEAILRARLTLYRTWPTWQRGYLKALRAEGELHARKGRAPTAPTPARDTLVSRLRAAAERYCPDREAIGALVAAVALFPDEDLTRIAEDLEKLAECQAQDLRLVLALDARAEASAERAAQRDAERQARQARVEAKRQELDAKMAALRAQRAAR